VCADIVNELPLAQPRIPTLKGIKKRGLIKGNFEGNAICYCLDEEGFNKIRGFSAHKYVFSKKINVVNFKLVENEVIRN
jgi:hypothetical protein